MTEELRNQDLKDSARRKLVRGVFAVPAVLTLHCGGAIAATTTATRCLVNRNSTNSPTQDPSTSGDTMWLWYRLRVQTSAVGTVTHWISGMDLDVLKRKNVTKPFVRKVSGNWQGQRFDPSSNMLIGERTSDPDCTAFPQTGKYVLLRVDNTGAVVGAGASGGAFPVSGTCWTSFSISLLA